MSAVGQLWPSDDNDVNDDKDNVNRLDRGAERNKKIESDMENDKEYNDDGGDDEDDDDDKDNVNLLDRGAER